MRQEIIIGDNGRRMKMTVWSNSTHNRVLLVAPGIGVGRRFYTSIATFFHAQDYNVLVFDYAEAMSDEDRLVDWGIRDITRAIDYATTTFSGQDIFFLGHSMAGQVLPLATNANRIKAAMLIASQNVATRYWHGWSFLTLMFYWRVVIPLCLKFAGYLPGFVYGGNDLPGGIARDWKAWAVTRDGILSAVPGAIDAYQGFKAPIKFISFQPDFFAPPRAVERLVTSYGSSTKEHEQFSRASMPMRGNMHFAFFREQNAAYWLGLEQWFSRWQSVREIRKVG
jgi:predicted alpha/beta hydrolase